ncbi:MAG: hypothetical protein COX80_04395 [Candidatus Magasanikbacteria bacterium CG_4_10_14_0_2_um_filter_33_14]|uniref:Uncharacterized protein n=1 Tax=Candidatus Magasanikbacteria bacterium CG_4_10_14_0_2_um_filter_33_14 TaxID=1974636 RepID=A0A2M7V9H5_9BACT|nr:MAG: hypothetical protein COX80_04395 [Candidatus Magasanikbacteria bacterium CG_4_10_14_0_2_um_filter_33_14]
MSLDWTKISEDTIVTSITAIIVAIISILPIKSIYKNRQKIYNWFKKQRLIFFPVNFNIAFSLNFQEGINSGNYFKQIKKNIFNTIDNLNLQKQIKIRDFSDIKKFNNRNEAETFRNKKDIDLIIWGDFTNDFLKIDGENINEINLKFTYGHPDNETGSIGKMIKVDLSSKLAEKNYWKILENNSLKDIKIISDNIFDISTYILALILKISGRIEDSLKLFEVLHTNLCERNDIFQKNILPHLYDCYSLLIIEQGIYNKKFEKGVELCLKILKIKENDFFALSNLATFKCKLNKNEEAEILVKKLQEIYPGDPVTEVAIAYFNILQKSYTSAFKHYRNITNFKAINFNQDVIEFLGEEYEKTKEPALLYGSGIISYYFWDKKLAKDNLKKFIKKANINIYKPMYREAKRILKK